MYLLTVQCCLKDLHQLQCNLCHKERMSLQGHLGNSPWGGGGGGGGGAHQSSGTASGEGGRGGI